MSFAENIDTNTFGYWKDYTLFIQEVERISTFSPHSLFDSYISWIESLEQNKSYHRIYEQIQEEIDYDEMSIGNLIKNVHEVLDAKKLKRNLLHVEFAIGIKQLDVRFEKFIKEPFRNNKSWITDFEFGKMNWKGINETI
jgi:uncharacterized protein (UPF0335 family)